MARRETLLSAPYQTRPSDGEGGTPTDRRLRGLSLAATIAALVTVVLGAVVRVTGSGDACGDDWPVCNGRLVPEFDAKVLIEYTHRLATPVLVVLVGALAFVAVRRYRRERRVVVPAVAAFLVLFVQAGLGALVVRTALSAGLVTAHLATAMLLVGTLVLATTGAWTLRRTRHAEARPRWTWIGAVLLYAAILAGAFVRGEGAGLAFKDWPLMDGRLVPGAEWGVPHVAQFVHRFLAVASFAAVAWVAVAAWRRRAGRAVAAAALVTMSLQVIVGALNVWTDLAAGARIAHVALAALAWAAIVAATALGRTEART